MTSRLFLLCLLSFISILPVQASNIPPLYLDQLIDGSAIAFQGDCIDNRTERDAHTGLIVTYTTFQVQDVLKGQVGSTHTIKQMGGRLPGPAGSIEVYVVKGVPKFEVGESYVVFLYGISAAGFSSPVGLDQGTFKVLTGSAGLQVTNGRDFKEMTADIPLQQAGKAEKKLHQAPGPAGHMGLDDFKQLVRQQVGGAR